MAEENKNASPESTVDKKSTDKDFEKSAKAKADEHAEAVKKAAKRQGEDRKAEIDKEIEALEARKERLEAEKKQLGSGDQKRLDRAIKQLQDGVTGHERENTPGTREHAAATGR